MQKIHQRYNQICFKSGISPKIKKAIQEIKIANIENAFKKDYGVDANFGENKICTFGFASVINIIEECCEKFKLSFFALPPKIRAFKRIDLKDTKLPNNFCITDTRCVLRQEPPFELRSIFVNMSDNILEFDNLLDVQYMAKKRSSSHFLSEYIHEWMHNIHLDLIFNKYGYEGNCPYAKSLYPSNGATGLKKVSEMSVPLENSIRKNAQDAFGSHSQISKLELFAEGMTKLITDSIDKKTLSVRKNPLDGLNKLPKNIADFILNQFS